MDANTEMENGGWNLPEPSRSWEGQNDSKQWGTAPPAERSRSYYDPSPMNSKRALQRLPMLCSQLSRALASPPARVQHALSIGDEPR